MPSYAAFLALLSVSAFASASASPAKPFSLLKNARASSAAAPSASIDISQGYIDKEGQSAWWSADDKYNPPSVSSKAGQGRQHASKSSSAPQASIKRRDEPETTACPSVELVEQTATSFTVITTSVSTDSETSTSTHHDETVTVTVQTTASSNSYIYAVTSTFTAAVSTTYEFDVYEAEATETVPIPYGFTPVLCLAAYLQPTVTTTITSYTTGYERPVETVCAEEPLTVTVTDYTSTEIRTISRDATINDWTYPTTTETVTRAEATSTVYAACATNNVVADAPDGGYILAATSQRGTKEVTVAAIDAEDCCNLCQADPSCLSSAYTDSWKTFCTHFVKVEPSTAICNFTANAAKAVGSWDERPGVWISNSGCGQFTFSGGIIV